MVTLSAALTTVTLQPESLLSLTEVVLNDFVVVVVAELKLWMMIVIVVIVVIVAVENQKCL